ncbi:hypothetical protein [Treponema sp. R6D11]
MAHGATGKGNDQVKFDKPLRIGVVEQFPRSKTCETGVVERVG